MSVEAQVWFEWHNGVDEARPGFHGEELRFTGSDFELLSLERCIKRYRRMRALAEELERHDEQLVADERWAPAWFPFAGRLSGDLLFLDCSVPDGEASPVHYFASHDVWAYSQQPRAPSLADTVALWVEIFDRGLWASDRTQQRWIERFEDFDERLRLSDLV